MMLAPFAMSMIELLWRVSAPRPAVLLVAPCSDKPPVLNATVVEPLALSVIPAALLIRSVVAPLRSNVPPVLTVILEVLPSALVAPVFSVPALTVDAPV